LTVIAAANALNAIAIPLTQPASPTSFELAERLIAATSRSERRHLHQKIGAELHTGFERSFH
jgi:hypothetical protein